MAVTAKFIADFSSFNDAVNKAEVELRSFETSAGKVEKSLQRMTDSFSGRKLIADATLMAEAVERVGGTTKLTAQELAKVGSTAAEAAAKMRALGIEVPPGIQKIADQTQHLNKSQTDLIGTLKNVAGAFGIAFSAQALVGFVRKVFDTASAVRDMATTLGISTDAAQEFAFAAQQTGTNMGVIERAIFKVNDALATGKDSFRGALRQAGLELNDLRNQKPEDAFRAMTEAIRLLPPEFDKTRVASELFGEKLAKELMPAILEGFVAIGKQAPKMSGDTIKALEEAQDAWEKFGTAVVVHSGNMLSAVGKLPGVFKDIASSGKTFAVFLENMRVGGIGFAVGMAGVAKEAKAADIALEPMPKKLGKTSEELREAAEAAKKFAAEQKKSVEALRDFKNFLGIREMEDYAAAQKKAAEQIEENVKLEFAMGKFYRDNAAALGAYAGNVGLFTEQWVGFGSLAPGIVKNITDSGKLLKSTFVDELGIVSSILQGIQNDFAQMAVVAIRAGEQIQKVWESTAKPGKKFSGILTAGLAAGASIAGNNRTGSTLGGAASGAAIGSFFGPIGTGVGAGVGALIGFFKDRSAKKKVDEMRQGLIDMMGGWEGINSAAHKAGITLERVLNARTVQEYEAAVNELNEAIAFQDQAMATLKETAEKYGFTLEELGPKFQAAMLDEKAQELFKDFQVLTAAGIDVDTVLGKMSGSINEFVQNSVAMGIAVPAAMRPMIERMIELGLLTDKNGTVIENLEQSGVTFAMSMSEGFQKLIDEVKRLTDAIARGLGIALDDIAGKIENMPDINVGTNVPDVQTPNVPGFASGTGGRYLNFGKGTLAMLHGRERIMTEGEGGGGVVVNVYGSVSTERDLIDAIRQGLNDTSGRRMRAA